VRDAVRVAERVQEQLQRPLTLLGHDLVVSASIGIAVNTSERNEPGALLKAADVAMYRAKAGGKAQHEVFDSAMGMRATERLEI
jgi:diguanylate cyclase (GGDEF)-like protein